MRGRPIPGYGPSRSLTGLWVLLIAAFGTTLWLATVVAPAAHADTRGAASSGSGSSDTDPRPSAARSTAARTVLAPTAVTTASRTSLATAATPATAQDTSSTSRASRTLPSESALPALPQIQVSTQPTRIASAVMATLTTASAATSAAASGASANNLGFGNMGQWNLGNGNSGDFNVGSGNAGDRNIGFGNLGSDNVGAGNSGDGNVGLGNTGNNNIGFGNTGNNCVGIGLTGDNQIGFGGWNSGTGNTGLFNSGSGNSGFFNSGTGNFGIGNSGTVNTGLFNAGGFNTGWNNVGNANTGHANTGDANTGGFNSGNTNTGWANSGNANTGLANSGNVNTGAFISGNLSNGFFVTGDEQNWLPSVRYTTTLPGLTIDDNLPLTIDQTTTSAELTVIVGPTTANVHVTGTTAPIEVVLFETPSGPGFFNSTDSPSSGLFNSGSGGGSGLFNVGEGVSGLWNAAVAQLLSGPALVSGLGNYGLFTSGVGNLGSGISGLSNLSALDPWVAASLAGLGNVGAGFAGALWNSASGLPAVNLGFGDLGSLNAGGGNVGDFNLGFGNVGRWNLGNGNVGDLNIGSGNAGDENVGFGNLGSKNVGAGNSGDGNVGLGNTGNNNIGFGNTGNNCVGIGLTGDNQIGFGGWNSGTGNTGLFNSGSGNSGFFNSGTGNFGFGNSGTVNTGLFNAGGFNTGVNNAGSYNTGHANVGDANTGGFNVGNINTGWANTGDANTGLANNGNLNTGALNLGNRNNGFLWRTNDNGQLNVDIGSTISEVPVTLKADIPVDIPITGIVPLGQGPVTIYAGGPLPAITVPVGINTRTDLQPGVTLDLAAQGALNLGSIVLPPISVVPDSNPLFTARIGDANTDVAINLTGTIGPVRLSLLKWTGPGFFNSTDSPSSGLFNSGSGGGSGLFNLGEGVSGLWNAAVAQLLGGPALVSGLGNYALLGSGVGNLGSGISGLSNLSALDPWVAASLAGLGNVGAGFAGALWNSVSGLPAVNLGFGDVGSLNAGGGNVGDFNLGFGNVGRWNLGNGNVGDLNIGSGNAGDENVGFGNLGSNNVGAGNTGNNNIGFGNTGNNCVGIGLTGDNQVGFGGWNSGTNNTGLFNSGSGNSGFFNSGTNNTGLFNSGNYNTGWSNAGSYNTGNTNAGAANTGGFNTGNTNTGWLNTGDANTGLANYGDLNTGALNLGNRNNGFLLRTNDNGQLNIGLGLTISAIPVDLAADVPVNIPITAIVGPDASPDVIDVLGFTVPTIAGGLQLTPITLTANIDKGNLIKIVAGPIVFNQSPDVTIDPIAVPNFTLTSTDPLLTGSIGSPDTSIPVRIGGQIGPTRISLLAFGGPGLFNSIVTPSSGFFNSSGGVDIGATVSSISANLSARIPLNIPVTAELGSVGTLGGTIPGFSINTTNWTTIANQPFIATLDGQAIAHVFDFTVPNGLFAVSDITIPAVTVDLPRVTGSIGASDSAIPIDFSAESAPFRIIPLLAGSGGGSAVSSAPVAGGSGLFNSGAGLSGLLNQTLRFGLLSGLLNQGSLGSGTGNAGVGNSGWVNTGTEQSGVFGGWPGIGTLLSRVIDRLRPFEPPAIRGVTVTDVVLGYSLDVPVDVPTVATFANPVEIPFVTIPTVSIGPLLGSRAFIEAAILNKAKGADSNYPTNNPCGASTDPGACVPFQLAPSFTIGGGAGPITIAPGGILTPNGQQVFSTEIGGIGQGIRASGTVAAGPINILPGAPVTVEQFSYVYQGAVTTDLPVTTEVGAIISQFDAQDIIGGTMAFKYGYCYLTGTKNNCTPTGLQTYGDAVLPKNQCAGETPRSTCYVSYFVWGDPINQHTWRGYPPGAFPPDSVIIPGSVPLADTSGTFVNGGRILNFVLNSGSPTTTSFGGSGTLGPFPRPGG